MIKRAAQFVPLKLNTAKGDAKKLAQKFGVRGLPTILFVDSEGEVKDTLVGYKPAAAFAKALDDIASRQVTRARSAARKKPSDGEAQAHLGLALAIRGELDEAEAALLKARVARFRGPIVGRAYNSLGDQYRQRNAADKAIDAYKRADRIGKDALVRAYAESRLLETYRVRGDTRRAQRVAKALTRLKGAPQEYVDQARKFLGD